MTTFGKISNNDFFMRLHKMTRAVDGKLLFSFRWPYIRHLIPSLYRHPPTATIFVAARCHIISLINSIRPKELKK